MNLYETMNGTLVGPPSGKGAVPLVSIGPDSSGKAMYVPAREEDLRAAVKHTHEHGPNTVTEFRNHQLGCQECATTRLKFSYLFGGKA